MLMRGYLDSSLDADAFDDDGYFRTGDLGVSTTTAYVMITGRLKDIIIRKGENISAKEVEDLLFTHPKVADVAVIGAARRPHRASGRARWSWPRTPATRRRSTSCSTSCKSEGLMMQKLPEQLEIVDALPRNPTGKILKYELRDRYAKP